MKTYNLIDHTTLIKKMISLGLHESWLKWISFFNLLSQRTRASIKTYNEINLYCGPRPIIVPDNVKWGKYCAGEDLQVCRGHDTTHKLEQDNILLQDALTKCQGEHR